MALLRCGVFGTLLLACLVLCRVSNGEETSWKMKDRFYGFRFEVHGRVQGVWFRKHTQQKADELACFGWVQNTKHGTVVGEARCNKLNGPKFQKWLEKEGSPLSEITKLDVLVYEDTKIKLHFSDFPILDDERETCFHNEPHKCPPPSEEFQSREEALNLGSDEL